MVKMQSRKRGAIFTMVKMESRNRRPIFTNYSDTAKHARIVTVDHDVPHNHRRQTVKLNRIIRFRASEDDTRRVNEIADKVGCTVSDVLRQLVGSAELEPRTTFRPICKFAEKVPQQKN